jgi:predicted metal-dependent hydrolase
MAVQSPLPFVAPLSDSSRPAPLEPAAMPARPPKSSAQALDSSAPADSSAIQGTTGAPAPNFIRHPRAKRYVLRVRTDGTVRVTIPRWGSKREAQAFVHAQRQWILEQQTEVARARASEPRRPTVTPERRRELLVQASRELPSRLLELADRFGLRVSRISIRNQRWRWGSCSRQGHICLNWRLVGMPADVRDYVLIHELMHLKRMDHSPKFWALVAAACPGYQQARRWLREHAPGLLEN